MKHWTKTLGIVLVVSLSVALVGCVGIWAFLQGQETARLRQELAQAIKLLPQGTPTPTPEVAPSPFESPMPSPGIDKFGIPENPVIPGRVTQATGSSVKWPQSETELITTLSSRLAAAADQPSVFAGVTSDVRWFSSPQSLTLTDEILKQIFKNTTDRSANNYSLEQVGEFIAGAYAGKQAVRLGEFGMGTSYFLFALDPTTRRAVLLVNYPFDNVDVDDEWEKTIVSVDRAYRFKNLDYPENFEPIAGIRLQQAEYGFFDDKVFPSTTAKLLVRQTAIGDLYYLETRHLFVAESTSGHAVYYNTVIPFSRKPAQTYSGVMATEFQLTWWYGSSTSSYLATKIGGCGSTNNMNVVVDISPTQLVQAGVTGSGDPIYEYSDLGTAALREQYGNWYIPFEGSKPAYEEYLGTHPMFFWQDRLGRLVQFMGGDYIPSVECAKPAIYLYPQQTNRVRVEVAPRGGFTYTEPPYLDGWEVTAMPDGTLTDIATGKNYPYLWWDGRGGLYAPPKNYWVVAQADVEPFLRGTLPQLGLNKQESTAFLEYWLPYFTSDHPYYKIGFHGNLAMDELAPLNITPQPDTVIRILMDYEGLSSMQLSNPPRIITSVRTGFTVVEWGGVRH